MAVINFNDLNAENIKQVQDRVEEHSEVINKIVTEIISPYCSDLDKYVKFISDCLKDGERPPTTEELDDFCMNLSTLIYFAGGICEQIVRPMTPCSWRRR